MSRLTVAMTLAIGALATLTVDGIKSLAIDLFGLTLTTRVIQVISLLALPTPRPRAG